MLTEICGFLKNWFDRGQDKFTGTFTIEDGVISCQDGTDMGIQENQYFRIIGSVFNDGVHRFGDDDLTAERPFDGAVWLMAVPPDVIALATDIQAWQDKYGGVDSENMSPYASESFDGYSYTKAQGYASVGGGMLNDWTSVFASRLMRYKRI